MKNFAARELFAIASLDGAIAHARDPEFTLLLRTAKSGHQDAYARVMALTRLEGRDPAPVSRGVAVLMKLEGRLAQVSGSAVTLNVMHFLEDHFVAAYHEAESESEGLRRQVLAELARLAERRRAVIAAHLAPHPETFVARPLRTCMRCLLDRPGKHAAIVREDPHTFVCAACHDEVRLEYPLDLAAQIDSWLPRVREDRIVEKALSQTSKHHARTSVHAKLAGQPDATPTKSTPMPVELIERNPRVGPRPIAAITTMADVGDGLENDYTLALFDFRSLRADW
jgi:hypothetical protein